MKSENISKIGILLCFISSIMSIFSIFTGLPNYGLNWIFLGIAVIVFILEIKVRKKEKSK